MKKNIIFLLLILPFLSLSQTDKGMVNYKFINALGSGSGYGPTYNSYLVFNMKKSNYITAKDSLETVDDLYGQKVLKDEEGEVVAILNGLKSSSVGDQVVIDLEKDTIFSSLYFKGEMLYLKEKNSKQQWKITNETKKIGSFNAKKATLNFRGRTFIAWFSTEIPVPFGPWKIRGLPGLVLEAYDKGKYVWWVFESISYPDKTNIGINNLQFLPSDSEKDYKSYNQYLLFIEEVHQRLIEKNLIIEKETGVNIFSPKINQLFIEFDK